MHGNLWNVTNLKDQVMSVKFNADVHGFMIQNDEVIYGIAISSAFKKYSFLYF